jgi:lysophospholipase L1-like esterase
VKKFLFTILLISIFSHSQNKTNFDQLYPDKNIKIEYHDDWGRNNYNKIIEEFKKSPLKVGDIVFLGNSITQGGKDWSKRFNYPNIRNRGIGGDVTDGILARIREIYYYKPRAVFLLIGINDLYNNSPSDPSPKYIANNIVKIAYLIKKESPNTQIFVQTTLPINRLDLIGKVNNEKIKENITIINTLIKKNENINIYKVIDLYSVFVNDEGLIKSEFTHDGVHLNERGYKAWVDFVKPILYTFKK